MAAVPEAVGTPALDKADAHFEAEALEAYRLTGEAIETRALDGLIAAATARARAAGPAKRRIR